MKKLFRNIFSGYFLVLLFLILEILVIIFISFFLDDVITTFLGSDEADYRELSVVILGTLRILSYILALYIFFKIINKQEDPEFKIPWIVVMLILPFFGSMMYLIFANHGIRKSEKKVMDAIIKANNKHNSHSQEEKDFFMQDTDRAYGTLKYITSTTRLGAHRCNKVKYYKCGEEFFPDFIEGLKNAKEFIFIEFFIIADGKEWDAVKNILIEKADAGVDVRLIYDDMGSGGTISHFTHKQLGKHGIKCYKFHPFRPILNGVYNNRDHRKIVVIDHEMAFTGGINLADEYANEIVRFGYWKDTMVKIQGKAINNLISIFLQNYDLCRKQVSNYDEFMEYDYPRYEEEGYVMPFGDGPGGIDNHLIGEQTYINILNYAKEEIYISTPYLVPTYGLLDALRNASLRGVKVHLILPGIPDKRLVYAVAKSHFRYLLDSGVHIYIYKPGFNHMKTCLADDSLAFVGTINFDFRSLVHHFECGTVLYNNPCLKDIKADFEEMISVSEPVPQDFKLNKVTSALLALLKIFNALL